MTSTRVVRMTVTSHDGSMDFPSMTTVTRRRGSRTIRYSTGWKNTEEDRKPAPRVARVISQDYDVIKRECLAQKALWEDPEFPATDSSLYPSSTGPLPFKWIRASVSVFCEAALRVQYAR